MQEKPEDLRILPHTEFLKQEFTLFFLDTLHEGGQGRPRGCGVLCGAFYVMDLHGFCSPVVVGACCLPFVLLPDACLPPRARHFFPSTLHNPVQANVEGATGMRCFSPKPVLHFVLRDGR